MGLPSEDSLISAFAECCSVQVLSAVAGWAVAAGGQRAGWAACRVG